jgi:hypothetical protein
MTTDLRRWAVTTGLAAALVAPTGVRAQELPLPVDPGAPIDVQTPSPALRMGFRAFATIDVNRMAASQSFEAVVGTSDLTGFGAGAEILRLWHGAFARVGFSRIRADGTRVVVLDDEATPIGVSTSVRMMPLELGGGWRFGRRGRFVPYGGGGLVRLAYEETTDVDQPGEDTSETFTGSMFFGGVDVQIAGALGFGAELQHRRLANALGTAGASAAFRETDLGGLTFRLWIGFGR